MLTGNQYANVLDGGKGDDTLISGGGADKLLGGEGNDQIAVLSITNIADLTIDGGVGIDTLQLSGLTVNLTLVPDASIQGIERIDMSSGGGSVLTASAHDIEVLSNTSASLFITGDASDRVILTDAAKFSGQTIVDGITYRSYAYGNSTIHIDPDILISGMPVSKINLSNITDAEGFRINGFDNQGNFGAMLSGVGDVNQDGFEDVIVSGGLTAYLLYGQGGPS